MKKKAVKLVVFLVVALVVFLGLSEGSKDIARTSLTSIKGFYTEPKNSLDVVLIGASQVYTGYSPTIAWQKQGYTSFDFASEGVPGTVYKSMLKEVLRSQKPKLVVFEINGFLYGDDYLKRSGSLHKYIDSIKISKNWVETIKERIPEEEQKDYFFPISTYHDNWKNPGGSVKSIVAKAVIKMQHCSNLKGIATLSLYRNTQKELGVDQRIMLSDQSREYLEELCKTCQEEGVENVLFVRFPHLRTVGNPNVYPEIEKIVNSYGYGFLDMTDYEQFGLDRDHDYYDADHMNFYGMKKFTTFFSEYLATHYDLPTKHDENVEQEWTACAKKADEVFQRCEEDFEKGVGRRYTETSCYFEPEVIRERHED